MNVRIVSKKYIVFNFFAIHSSLTKKIEKLKSKGSQETEEEMLKLEQELEAHHLYVQEMVEGRQDDATLKVILKAQDKGTLETLLDQISKLANKYDGTSTLKTIF